MALPRRKYIRSNSLPVNKIPAQLQRSTEGNHDGSGGIERTQSLQTCREETAAVRMLPVVKIENMASSRIAPVVLWGATPPSHSITSVLVSQNEETIVTGSKEGQLCLWDLSRDKGNEVQIYPRQLLFGHSSSITALADSPNGSTNFALVSVTKCGQIFVWDVSDGTCLHSRNIPGHHHTHIRVFQVPGRPEQSPRLLVQGYYNDLFVLDLATFDILFLLRQKVNPSWITAVSLVENAFTQSTTLLGLNEDGFVKTWTLKPSELRSSEPVDDDKQHFVGITNGVSLSTNPYGSAMTLVVAQDSWQLFDISEGGFMQLCHHGNDVNSVALTGGAFVERYQVLIWRSDCSASLYQLTRRCHTQMELKDVDGVGVEPAPPDAPEATICLCELRASDPFPALQPAFSFFHLSHPLASSKKVPNRLFLTGNSSGQLHAWYLPVQDHVMDLLCQYAKRHMHSPSSPSVLEPTSAIEQIAPIAKAKLSDAWLPPARPLGLVDFVGAKKDALQLAAAASTDRMSKSSSAVKVTASLYLRQQGRVVCGRADGAIIVVTATHAAAMHLLRATGKWRAGLPHLHLCGHHGAVTALLHPHSEDSSRYEIDHLISGGEDFTVRLWDVMQGVLIYTFSMHGGIVRHLLCLPPSNAPRLQSCLCSVADDHSVAIISLKECRCLLMAASHVFPVAGIRWRLAHDFLLVACTDGTLYVWEIETGQLDRCVNGSVAADILGAGQDYHGSGVLDPTGEHSSAVVSGLSSSFQFKGSRMQASLATTSLSSSLTEVSSSLLEVVGLQASRRDPFGHVLLFNCTQLINRLITEQKHVSVGGGEDTWQNKLTDEPADPAPKISVSPTGKAPANRRSVQAPSPTSEQRPSGPTPGSSDYFRRYLGGRRALSAHAGSSSSSSSGSNSNTRASISSAQPVGRAPSIAGELPSSSAGLSPKEQNKAKRLIGEAMANNQSGRRKEPSQSANSGMNPQEVAHLLLSLLYSWGVSDLDRSCRSSLGLVEPARPLSFGLVSRNGCMALLVPGWTFRNRYTSASSPSSKACDSQVPSWTTVDSDTATSPEAPLEKLLVSHPSLRPSLAHWQVSSALSTQHLLCIVAVSNTLMTLTKQDITIPDSPSDHESASEDEDHSNHMESIRAGWSQVAALHCVMLHEHLGPHYQPPLLTALARRWQDSCLEVRDAAQSILQSELRRIGSEGRKKIIADWLPYLPRSQAAAGLGNPRVAMKTTSFSDERAASPVTPSEGAASLERSGNAPSSGKSGVDNMRQQAVSMVLLALVCSEFTTDCTPSRASKGTTLPAKRSSRANLPISKTSSASAMSSRPAENLETNVVRLTGKALEYMLLAPPSPKFPLNGATRRTAADLMGRSFNMWVSYVDTPAIIFALLRLYGASTKKSISVDGAVSGNAQRSAQETRATLRSAHHALSLLALSRPAEFVSTIAKEVAAFSPASSALAQMMAEHRSATALEASTRDQTSPAAAPPMSPGSVTLGGTGGGVEGDVLTKCHGKILKILELLVEKMTEDIILQLLEVVDIVLHCVDDDRLRQHGLASSFPGLSRFNMVSFCATTRRLAVGARTGQMAIYDLRSPRCQVITAHTCPVTALSFSPDGRLLVTYSYGDSKLSFWQMSGSLFGMLSSGMRCIKSFATEPAPPLPVLSQLRIFNLVWVNQRSVILLSHEKKEQKFSV